MPEWLKKDWLIWRIAEAGLDTYSNVRDRWTLSEACAAHVLLDALGDARKRANAAASKN
jgi:hypothetical protein